MKTDDRVVILIKIILWGMDGWYISTNDSDEIFGKDVKDVFQGIDILRILSHTVYS